MFNQQVGMVTGMTAGNFHPPRLADSGNNSNPDVGYMAELTPRAAHAHEILQDVWFIIAGARAVL